MSIPYIILALFIFGALIFIHELGHFLAARACGVGILEFSIGMGPKLFSKKSKKSGTVYSLRLFPIGGYVSMLGENGLEAVQGENGMKDGEDTDDGGSVFLNSEEKEAEREAPVPTVDPELERHAYCNQSVWKRILISIAGPLMNVVLGFLLMFVIVWVSGDGSLGTTKVAGFFVQYTAESEQYGFKQNDYITYAKVSGAPSEETRQVLSAAQLIEMAKQSETGTVDLMVSRYDAEGRVVEEILRNVPINDAFVSQYFRQSLTSEHLQINDVIVKVNSASVHTDRELQYEISNQGYKPVTLTVERDGNEVVLENVVFPQYTDPASNTLFGEVDFIVFAERDFDFVTIVKHAWFRSVSTVKMVYDSLIGLFSGRFGAEAVSGPVGITKTISDVAQTGYLNVIYLVAVITINLGVMNLLPFPALDGGHLLLYLVEIVRRKPVKKEVEGIINFVGLVILLTLAVIIMIKDVIAL